MPTFPAELLSCPVALHSLAHSQPYCALMPCCVSHAMRAVPLRSLQETEELKRQSYSKLA